MNYKLITDTMINKLRTDIKLKLSYDRYRHTLGVEDAAVRIASVLALPESEINILRAAALLHDITKEYSLEKQLKICDKFGIILRDDEIKSPSIIHAISAAAILPITYAEFAHKEVVDCVRWHTTGKKDMTLLEKIICLADYIEDTRDYYECIKLRTDFWSSIDYCLGKEHNLLCIDNAVVISLQNTVNRLKEKGCIINFDTIEAIDFIKKLNTDK